jgi:hypothetical protein
MPMIEIYANGVLIGRATLSGIDEGMAVGSISTNRSLRGGPATNHGSS